MLKAMLRPEKKVLDTIRRKGSWPWCFPAEQLGKWVISTEAQSCRFLPWLICWESLVWGRALKPWGLSLLTHQCKTGLDFSRSFVGQFYWDTLMFEVKWFHLSFKNIYAIVISYVRMGSHNTFRPILILHSAGYYLNFGEQWTQMFFSSVWVIQGSNEEMHSSSRILLALIVAANEGVLLLALMISVG